MTAAPAPRTTAVIVNWNGARFLPRCLEALAAQSVPVRVVVVDNASSDGSVGLLRAEHPEAEVVALAENAGYAAGANAGLRVATTPYALVMNADVALAPDHVERLAARLDSDPSIGAAQGKLLQVAPDAFLRGELESERVDSAGHVARRTRMVYDIGQGEPDGPRYVEERSVFSACGAALFLRRAMLDDLAPDGEFFDEAFFAYKEDIDLCWRARLLGWDVRYVPAAVGYHVRGWAGGAPPDPRKMPASVRRHSWKNHYLMIVKNDRPADVLRALPQVVGWEVLRLGYAALRDRSLFRVYLELPRLLREALRKRREIMRRRRVEPAEMRRWFGAP